MDMLKTLFGFDPEQHKVRTEIVAGVTTFLTMSYILAVNPGIFSALEPLGMPTNSVFTATALAAFVTMIMMPMSYSISDGIMLGIIVYVLMNVCTGKKAYKKPVPPFGCSSSFSCCDMCRRVCDVELTIVYGRKNIH